MISIHLAAAHTGLPVDATCAESSVVTTRAPSSCSPVLPAGARSPSRLTVAAACRASMRNSPDRVVQAIRGERDGRTV